ncbi:MULTISPECIES: GH32 C-terminal domain-containing protein [Microbacterium]|uniref:GH32 C-terminal domain-containing protein n=1 Tax=Microbacterium TaxID=33882 RepID=UPI00217CE30E|nr:MULTISPECIES: GH32 C-terminal domain-containing protein [Microbacterium]UWF76834.1 GH32 C-terminal domain-containing protein [Microbacterium neungamense]WCM54989.1 GH32 C-terminal domain-containing protein [Microbacterium sp. EF45047]
MLGHDDAGNGGVRIAYDAESGVLTHDRTGAGTAFPDAFRTVQRMPVGAGRRLAFTAWLDVSSVEIFADGGVSVLTDLTDVKAGERVSVRGLGGPVELERFAVAAPRG